MPASSPASAPGHTARPQSVRPTFSPPRSHVEKDQLIEKLVLDNETLMKEVAELDAQLRQVTEQRELIAAENAVLLKDQQERESASQISERMLRSIEEQAAVVRAEREEQARQHASDRQSLTNIFSELEAQLSLARRERDELQSRADRERKVSVRKVRELEERLQDALASREQMQEACDREMDRLVMQFDHRIAGLRLENEQACVDRSLLRRLEGELAELKALSTSVLGAAPMMARSLS